MIRDAARCPTLLFDPDVHRGHDLARRLRREGISVHVAKNSRNALSLARRGAYSVSIVMADLSDRNCLGFLDKVYRAARRTWLIVGCATVDRAARNLVYRHGGDALVTTPIDVKELARRVVNLNVRSKPLY